MATSDGNPPSYGDPPVQHALNSKVMIATMLILFLVLFFLLGIDVYARLFTRDSSGLTTRIVFRRRRNRLNFTGQESIVVGENVGLDKAVIDSLPMFVYKQPQKDEAVLECAVCLCEFEEDDKGRLLPNCNHSFHTECIGMWFYSHSTCPLCRINATPDRSCAAIV